MTSNIEDRLRQIEARLNRIESRIGTSLDIGPTVNSPPTSEPTNPTPTPTSAYATRTTSAAHPAPQTPAPRDTPLATKLLGWGGAAALVLAASYLVKLAWDAGWLTPVRQIAISVLAGIALIAAGLQLRSRDPDYAGLLPAAGVVILFIATYAAHLYYGLIPPAVALAAITITSLLSLWLCRHFQSSLYAFFAVAGSYSVPLLLPSLMQNVTSLAIYFTCWSVVFSMFSIIIGNRNIYLLALYLSLIGFHAAWRYGSHGDTWLPALIFQTLQLSIFAATTAVFSARRQQPLDSANALAHLPALLIFYFLQYDLLQTYLPAYAAWIAIGSAAILATCYWLAQQSMGKSLPGGRLLAGAYVALVLFHAGYLQSVPDQAAPWVAFVLLLLAGVFTAFKPDGIVSSTPVWIAVIGIYAINYLRILIDHDMNSVAAPKLLAVLYALQLYAGYAMVRRADNGLQRFGTILLAAGHMAAICAIIQLFPDRLVVSLGWALLAILCLTLALRSRDKLLGKSSLLIFAISAAKVLFYDLSDSNPILRILTLVVVGISFYLGGWLYRKISAM